MKEFGGFQDSETFTSIPDSFFGEVLSRVKNLAELKVILHALWSVQHNQGGFRGLAVPDFLAAPLGLPAAHIRLALAKATEHGILLRSGSGTGTRYFLNSPRGRAAAAEFQAGGGHWAPASSMGPTEKPNLFTTYEENIGPLTPLIADALKDAEETYPQEWILEAINLAVKNNKRSWSYSEAILKRWKEEGRGKKQSGRDDQAARQRDVEEKIRKFIRG